MQTYNRSLDFVALAMDNMAKGRVKTAAKFFAQACTAPDAVQAMKIIEHSNAYAFNQRVEAKAKARAEASANPENRALAALGADPEELGMGPASEPEGEPGKVEDKSIMQEDEDDGADFKAALAALVKQ